MRAAANILVVMLALAARPALAAETSLAPPAPPAPVLLRLHLDCPDFTCDDEFLRREITWVDWVRDRADADVYILLTQRDTGSGGSELVFYVMRKAGGGPAADTLQVFAPATNSDDQNRHLIARTLEAALARDLVGRPEGERLEVRVAEPASAGAPAKAASDPWNHWLYKLSTNGYVNGEKSYQTYYLYSTVSASRVTDRSKLGLSVGQSYSENRYHLGQGLDFTSLTRTWNTRLIAVKSLTPHASAGMSASAYSSTFSNVDISAALGPAVEYDVFPYAESSRHSLTFGYQLRVLRNDYHETTLYGRTAETLLWHGADVTLALRQPWGSLDLGLGGGQYLHDLSKYRVTLSANADLRLWKGFSLTGYAYTSRIHDQLSLVRGDATDSEVIARRRQLGTAYQYYTSFGITYRFGSIFNTVVNDRLQNTLGSP